MRFLFRIVLLCVIFDEILAWTTFHTCKEHQQGPQLRFSIQRRALSQDHDDVTATTTKTITNSNDVTFFAIQQRQKQEQKFKIITCMSTSCCQKRKALDLDSLATFGAMYARASEASSKVKVEEGPCLGSCKKAPCIAIEHEDYIGSVSLEGMTNDEFAARA
jgi:hypothetical protein